MDRLVHHAASAPRVYRSLAMDPQVLRRERVEVNRRSKRLPDQRRVVAGGRLVEGGEREVPPRLPRLDTLLREGGELAGLRLGRGPAAIPGRRRSLPVPGGGANRARGLS